jgi:hypothetical protein
MLLPPHEERAAPTNAALPPALARLLRIPRQYYVRQVDLDDDDDDTTTNHYGESAHHHHPAKRGSGNRINPRTARTPNTVPALGDALVYFPSLFLREFLSTICALVLNSRLGGDLFIAGPVVTLYVNIVFRRPLNNPFVTTLACLSAGDWRKANVAGYPGFSKERTQWWELLLYWAWMVGAQLSGAATAAAIRAHNDRVLGFEFIKGAAWGSGQIHFKANVDDSNTCWNRQYFGTAAPQTAVEIPVRLYRNATETMLKHSCLASVQWRWWFAEDLAAVLFVTVTYVHVWRWLRWDDMEQSNAHNREMRYWQKLITFSAATASVGLMTAITFPTANAGLHTSLFLGVYQSLNADKNVTSNALNEPLLRAFGGACGCLLAVGYEWALAWLDTKERGQSALADAVHKMLYIGGVPERPADAPAAGK